MKKQIYTKEEIKEILNNTNVKSCTEKYITFTDDFKLKALELDKRWFIPKKIFEEFWFPEYIINSATPWRSLKRWRYNKKNKWISWLIWNIKWRKKKEIYDISKMSKDEYIEYLETENAVLKELKKMIDWNSP